MHSSPSPERGKRRSALSRPWASVTVPSLKTTSLLWPELRNAKRVLTGFYLPFVFLVLSIWTASGQENSISFLSGGSWKLAPQSDVPESGEQISATGFSTASWLAAQVPGTVFGSYVLAGKEKDPNFGDNIYQVDVLKYDRNFWYRTDFSVPDAYRGRRIWLNLDAVNRDADVYVNGNKVGSMHGFLQRGRFDVTRLVKVGEKNTLAVLDYVPVLVGKDDAEMRTEIAEEQKTSLVRYSSARKTIAAPPLFAREAGIGCPRSRGSIWVSTKTFI